jgi:hypothetical protein
VVERAESELLEVVAALAAPHRLAGGLDRREEHPDERPDDRDHDEQFDERESAALARGAVVVGTGH